MHLRTWYVLQFGRVCTTSEARVANISNIAKASIVPSGNQPALSLPWNSTSGIQLALFPWWNICVVERWPAPRGLSRCVLL